jgi:hypothetical protein
MIPMALAQHPRTRRQIAWRQLQRPREWWARNASSWSNAVDGTMDWAVWMQRVGGSSGGEAARGEVLGSPAALDLPGSAPRVVVQMRWEKQTRAAGKDWQLRDELLVRMVIPR